jgi:adenosine deaminase
MNLKTLPKVELHCHLDGIVSPGMLKEIHREDSTFPIHPDQLEQAHPITNIKTFFEWWNFIKPIRGKLAKFYPIMKRHVERLKKQKVVYAEIMISAGEVPQEITGALKEIKMFRELVNQWEADDIQIEFLIALGRNKPPGSVEKLADCIIALHEAGLIVGVALAGPEPGYPVKPFHKTFARFCAEGLGIEIHAGEWCGPELVREALEYGFPDRIGHGVSLFQDPKLIDLFQKQQLHIELCPTSNLKTGSISQIEEHPVAKARESGFHFSINTDDPGPFQCSMESEYHLLHKVFGFKHSDFQTIYKNSLEARFQPNLRIKTDTSNNPDAANCEN